MNLQKLFEAQKKLDDHIIREKGLEGEDLLDKKTLALQVELGELAQNWRGFKFWSGRQEPVTNDLRVADYKESGEAILETYNPLLEEYVDCLHFILSIGNDLKSNPEFDEYIEFIELGNITEMNITQRLIWINNIACNVESHLPWHIDRLLFELLFLGEQLGFTWEQIEQAYFEKNEINHERQESGY